MLTHSYDHRNATTRENHSLLRKVAQQRNSPAHQHTYTATTQSEALRSLAYDRNQGGRDTGSRTIVPLEYWTIPVLHLLMQVVALLRFLPLANEPF